MCNIVKIYCSWKDYMIYSSCTNLNEENSLKIKFKIYECIEVMIIKSFVVACL